MARTFLLVLLVLVCVLVVYVAFLFHVRQNRVRLVSCQGNLRILQIAALSYTSDYDGRLPLSPTQGDWVARRWTASPMKVNFRRLYHIGAAEPGPLWPYLKNTCINRCPSDNNANTFEAGAHSSYTWNNALCGRLAENVTDQPLVWDRAPFHNHGRNLVIVGGKRAYLPEQGFAVMVH